METEEALPPTGPADATAPKAPYSLTVNSATVFIAGVAIQLIGFIGSLFVYRIFGGNTSTQGLYGTVQFLLLIASTINGLADLRLGSGYQLFLARGKAARENTGTYLVLRFLLVGTACVVVLLFSGVTVGGTSIAPTKEDFEVLAVLMTLPVLWTFETVYQNYFIGSGNSVKSQYPGLVEVLFRTPFIILAAAFLPTMLGLASAYLIGALAATCFCIPTIIPLWRRYRKREALLLFRYSWPLLGALGLSTVATNMIPFFVQGSLGATALNQFNLANGFRILALALPAAIMTPLFPYIANLHKRTEYHAIREGVWSALRYSSLLLIPGVVALAVYRVDFLQIVSSGYIGPAATPLAILVVSTIPASLALIIGTGLAAIGWRRLELYLTAMQVVLLFVLAFALMPPFGILPAGDGLIGASIAVLASGLAAFGLNAYFMHRLMAVRVFPKSIALIALSSVAAFIAISRANAFFPAYLDSAAAQLVIGTVIGFLAYFFFLALVGELTKEDIHRIGNSMGFPRRWLDAVASLCWRAVTPHVVPRVDVTDVPGLTSGYIPDDDESGSDAKLPPKR